MHSARRSACALPPVESLVTPTRLDAFDCLDLVLLVNGQHQRSLRRVEVEADDVHGGKMKPRCRISPAKRAHGREHLALTSASGAPSLDLASTSQGKRRAKSCGSAPPGDQGSAAPR